MADSKKSKNLVKGNKREKESERFQSSKSGDFSEKIKDNNPMEEYFTRLTILNPAARQGMPLNEPKRKGSFVRLAHAREEFVAPVLNKGKAAIRRRTERKSKS